MLARAIETTENSKTGPVSVTYAAQGSCPDDCVFKGSGCYAETGPTGIITNRLNKQSGDADPVAIATEEAEAIDSLTGRNDLRVHVVGDCKSNQTAEIVSKAMQRHRRKRGRKAWTYTHAWRNVDRSSWGSESVLASVETPAEIAEAQALGYATAIVVEKFESDKIYRLDGHKIVPCLAQTKGTQCIDCGLCMNAEALARTKTSIAFEVHGISKKKMLIQLEIKNKKS